MTPNNPENPPAVPSPDQGPEHNPDGLTKDQVGEGWRLLTVAEVSSRSRDSERDCDAFLPILKVWSSGYKGYDKSITYRRRVASEPEQARNNALNKLAYEQSGEPRTECPTCATRPRCDCADAYVADADCPKCGPLATRARIAELERENEQLKATMSVGWGQLLQSRDENKELRAIIETLTRERDEARAEAALQRECNEKHSELHRKVSQKALIDRDSLRAQLAASEKDRERLDWLEAKRWGMSNWLDEDCEHVWLVWDNDAGDISSARSQTTLRAAIDAAMKEAK